MTENGLITLPSAHGAKATADRLAAEIAAKGMTVFARIDHAAGAKEVGMALRPTEVLIFGNAKGGTPLMQAKQTHRHRSAFEGIGLGGCRRQGLAVLQRSRLDRAAPWRDGRHRGDKPPSRGLAALAKAATGA